MEHDFRKAIKPSIQATMPDGTVLDVLPPRKWQQEAYEKVLAESEHWESDGPLYDLVAMILSNNKAGQEVTAEGLKEVLDVDDLAEFLFLFADFVKGLAKNSQSPLIQRKKRGTRRRSPVRGRSW